MSRPVLRFLARPWVLTARVRCLVAALGVVYAVVAIFIWPSRPALMPAQCGVAAACVALALLPRRTRTWVAMLAALVASEVAVWVAGG